MNAQGFALNTALVAVTIVAMLLLTALNWQRLNGQLAQTPVLQWQQKQQLMSQLSATPVTQQGEELVSCPEQYASWQTELVACQRDTTSSGGAGRIVYRQLLKSVQVAEGW